MNNSNNPSGNPSGNSEEDPDLDLYQQVEEAIEKTRKLLQLRAPHFLPIMALAKFRPQPYEENSVASTDGKHIFFGKLFLDFPLTHQHNDGTYENGPAIFVMIHELLHVAWCHPWRMYLMKSRAGVPYSFCLLNSTMDAFINTVIQNWEPRACKTPEVGVFRNDIVKLRDEWMGNMNFQDLPLCLQNVDEDEVFMQQSCFKIHDELLKLPGAQKIRNNQSQGGKGPKCANAESGDGDGIGQEAQEDEGEDEVQEAENEKKMQQEIEKIIGPDQSGIGQDIMDPEDKDFDSNQENFKEMQEALESASKMPGSCPGNGVLEAIDMTPVNYPWKRILGPFLNRILVAKPDTDFRRPSRNMIASAAAFPHQPPVYSPGMGDWSTGARIALLIDTSGSVSDDLLMLFLRHMVTITRIANSPCDFICGDVDITYKKQNIDLEHFLGKKLEKQITGRGGTAFEPLIDQAIEWKADVIVYLTDGYANFPKKPRVPFLWAVPDNGLESKYFPWGKVLRIT